MAIRRIKNHGKWVWQARVAYRGLRKAAFRATKDEAKDAESELRAELKTRAQEAEQQANQPATLRQLLEFYVLDLTARGKSQATITRAGQTTIALKRLLPELLDRPVSKIGDADIFAFRAARLREGKHVERLIDGRPRRLPTKPSTVNRDLRTLRAALKKARPEYRFPAGAFFREDETRVRWLRPEEELLVLAGMPGSPQIRTIAHLAALTLMRLSEIRTLRRESVHLEQGVILLPQTKTEPRPVIVSAEAQKILRQQLEGHASEWVFPNPDGRPYDRSYIGRAFRKAARAAGLRDFRFHDLRHHGATIALNKGFTAPIVMALGGWKTERMMRRYAAVTDQTLRAAAEAVSGAEETRGARPSIAPHAPS